MSADLLKPEVTINTVKHVVSIQFKITNPPAYAELRELNFTYADTVRLRSALSNQFGKDPGSIDLKDTIDTITTRLQLK